MANKIYCSHRRATKKQIGRALAARLVHLNSTPVRGHSLEDIRSRDNVASVRMKVLLASW